MPFSVSDLIVYDSTDSLIGYIKDNVTQMYYEMLSEYSPWDIQDEIERTQQHLDDLKARISNTES